MPLMGLTETIEVIESNSEREILKMPHRHLREHHRRAHRYEGN